jgi:hypothetical protein
MQQIQNVSGMFLKLKDLDTLRANGLINLAANAKLGIVP